MNAEQTQIAPTYQVRKFDGTFKKKVCKSVVEKGKSRIEFEDKEVEGGYMVFFPAGHSIHVTSDDELRRLGFNVGPEMVDMTTGEKVSGSLPVNYEAREARRVKSDASMTKGR